MSTQDRVIDFMGMRRIAAALSLILLIVAIGSLAVRGLNLGLDFTGGTLVEVAYEKAVALSDIRSTLDEAGYDRATVVNYGAETDVLVRLQKSDNPRLGEELLEILEKGAEMGVELRRVEFVGPQVGKELRDQGGLALLLALGMVLVYISMRFQMKFALGAVAALVHDVLITLGVFSVAGWPVDLTVVAALLAVIGYSLNDTIVVSDRIRENFRKLRKQEPWEMINVSLTQMLGRTLVTSLTTLMVLVALATVGGEMIRGFALTLIVGVVVGTYSSIYVAANVMMAMGISKEDVMIPEKEGAEDNRVDDLP